jgi:CRP/FNR family transcriptional regulator, cyclic AMP receptor protein
MPRNPRGPSFDVQAFLAEKSNKSGLAKFRESQNLYTQGDSADSVFFIHKGDVKITVVSKRGKEAIIAIRGRNEFCGESALNGARMRLATATAISECEATRVAKETMARLLHQSEEFSDYFIQHILTRTVRLEADLVDHVFNDSEMRLARALVLLANFGGDQGPKSIPIKINQATLAVMIGTTRSRVNVFMNKFRKMRLIDYNGELRIQKSLLNFVLNQKPQI